MKKFRTKTELKTALNDLKALKRFANAHPLNKVRPGFIPGLNEMIKKTKQQLKTITND